jgi:hypothetical protein
MALPRTWFASLLFAAACSVACSAARADAPVAGPGMPPSSIALAIAPVKLRAPFDVQVLRGNGEALPTYGQRDRFYVQGNANERYIIRITNPTDRRVEAVVSVDGLDVIDGENGDLRKRGYIVPAYGETRIEGFRTSQADVATFRFSSVAGSYAGQKGKARNVGVIAVALFEEQAAPPEQIIVGQAPPPPPPRYNNYRDDEDDAGGYADAAPTAEPTTASRGDRFKADKLGKDEARMTRRAPAKKTAAAPASPPRASRPTPISPGGGAARYVPPADNYREADGESESLTLEGRSEEKERLGLGTEFGEQRTSSVSYTAFVRAPGRPVAIAELRYNDMSGLMALGIHVRPLPDASEIMTRETADPFPNDRFAQPAR